VAESEVAWDLSELFPSISDPSIEKTISDISDLAKTFEKKYRSKITTFSAPELLICLQEFEVFQSKFQDISLYAMLSFSANMMLPQTQALYDRINKLEANVGKQLAFFSLDIGALVKNNPQLIVDPILDRYKHWLERVQKKVAHILSEVEEQLILEKDQFGVNAWEELQSKWLNTRMFEVKVLGEKKILSYGEANGLLTHPDRATRESANKEIYGLLGKDGEIFASALRNICNDWISISERRRYTSPMTSSFLSNDIEQQIIENLLQTIENNVGVYRRYLNLKARLLGLPVLGNHDIVAPLAEGCAFKFSFEDAKDLVTRAYSRFEEEYAAAVKDLFARQHVDVSLRFGKRNGAFCAGWFNGKSSFILDNFTGSLSDIFTLAHELGHATHNYYAQKSQTLLNLRMPSVVSETASIFGELLLTDLLLDVAKSDAERKAVLSLVLDEAGMTTFQVTSRVWFEQTLYRSIKEGEYLDYKTICSHWVAARNRIYGGSVEWFPEMEAEWAMKPHYYMANYRFYNYPYVYAQMFVYALYQRYHKEGKDFASKLKDALGAGSSLSPVQIGELMNLEVSAGNFWQLGIKQFEYFTAELEKIACK